MFGSFGKGMTQKVAQGLLKKWLKGQKVDHSKGEVNTALMLFEEDDQVQLLVVKIAAGEVEGREGRKLYISEVVESVPLDEAL